MERTKAKDNVEGGAGGEEDEDLKGVCSHWTFTRGVIDLEEAELLDCTTPGPSAR